MQTFYGCIHLGEVIIPNGVTSIENWAFQDCACLSGVTLPKSVSSIGESAFQGCVGLTEITIPDGVVKIGRFAFRECTGLQKITLSNCLDFIGDRAFTGCNKLSDINSKNLTPPRISLDTYCFTDFSKKNGTLFIPEGSMDAYKAAHEWKEFFKIVVDNEALNIQPLRVYAYNGTIVIDTNKEEVVSIYNLNGQLVKSFKIQGRQSIPLKSGLYVVYANNTGMKVFVN